MMKYPIAERFKAPQGEGMFTGTPMAFIRLVGCSVGKGICTACDTDFEIIQHNLGGGLYEPQELLEWCGNYYHVCITGGEPFDRDLEPLVDVLLSDTNIQTVHIETSGTRNIPTWVVAGQSTDSVWLTVSPKPGWHSEAIDIADEVKVIYGGLGDGPGWPTVEQARLWARRGKAVYLQPRNDYKTIAKDNMNEVVGIVSI